jgi:hypothetical protein
MVPLTIDIKGGEWLGYLELSDVFVSKNVSINFHLLSLSADPQHQSLLSRLLPNNHTCLEDLLLVYFLVAPTITSLHHKRLHTTYD